MDHKAFKKQDYDSSLKFKDKVLPCYSKKEFERLYSNKPYRIIGELSKAENGKDAVLIGEDKISIARRGTKSRLLFKEAGYINVGDDDYVAIVKLRSSVIAGLLVLILLVVLLLLMLHGVESKKVEPKVNIDPNAALIEGDDSERVESEEGGGSVTMTYSLEASMSLSSNEIEIYFLNPNSSNHDAQVSMYVLDGDREIKIAESGRITPGHGLNKLTFNSDSATLSVGKYDCKYVVTLYDSDGGDKALISPEITDVVLDVLE